MSHFKGFLHHQVVFAVSSKTHETPRAGKDRERLSTGLSFFMLPPLGLEGGNQKEALAQTEARQLALPTTP